MGCSGGKWDVWEGYGTCGRGIGGLLEVWEGYEDWRGMGGVEGMVGVAGVRGGRGKGGVQKNARGHFRPPRKMLQWTSRYIYGTQNYGPLAC